MSFDWHHYLHLAEYLRVGARDAQGELPNIEAAQRSAVSRAYYAAFCLARDYASSELGYRLAGGADHRQLPQYLKDTHSRYHKARLANRLSRLRDWRNKCDYESMVPALSKMVESALEMARRAIQEDIA